MFFFPHAAGLTHPGNIYGPGNEFAANRRRLPASMESTVQPCHPSLIEPEASWVPAAFGLRRHISIRRYRGYLTYTRFSTATSAF